MGPVWREGRLTSLVYLLVSTKTRQWLGCDAMHSVPQGEEADRPCSRVYPVNGGQPASQPTSRPANPEGLPHERQCSLSGPLSFSDERHLHLSIRGYYGKRSGSWRKGWLCSKSLVSAPPQCMKIPRRKRDVDGFVLQGQIDDTIKVFQIVDDALCNAQDPPSGH